MEEARCRRHQPTRTPSWGEYLFFFSRVSLMALYIFCENFPAPVHVAYCRARPKVSGRTTNQEAGQSGPQYGLESPVEKNEERDRSILSKAMKHQMELTIRRLATAEGKSGEEIMPEGPITGARIRMRIFKLMDGWEPAQILQFADVVAAYEESFSSGNQAGKGLRTCYTQEDMDPEANMLRLLDCLPREEVRRLAEDLTLTISQDKNLEVMFNFASHKYGALANHLTASQILKLTQGREDVNLVTLGAAAAMFPRNHLVYYNRPRGSFFEEHRAEILSRIRAGEPLWDNDERAANSPMLQAVFDKAQEDTAGGILSQDSQMEILADIVREKVYTGTGPVAGSAGLLQVVTESCRIHDWAEEEPTLLGAERQSVGTLVRENEGPPQLHLKPVQPHYLTGKSKTQGFTSGSEDPLIPVTFTILDKNWTTTEVAMVAAEVARNFGCPVDESRMDLKSLGGSPSYLCRPVRIPREQDNNIEIQSAIRINAFLKALKRSLCREKPSMKCQGAIDAVKHGKPGLEYRGAQVYVREDVKELGSALMVNKKLAHNIHVCRICLNFTDKMIVMQKCGHMRCISCVRSSLLFQPPTATCPFCGQEATFIEVPPSYQPGILATSHLEERKYTHPIRQWNYTMMKVRRKFPISPIKLLMQQSQELMRRYPQISRPLSLVYKRDVAELIRIAPDIFMIRAQEGMDFEVFWRWVLIARGVEPLSTLEFQYEDSEYVPEPQDQATRREKTNLNTSRISPQYLGLTRRMKERDHHRVLQDEFEEEEAAVEAIDVSEAPNLVEGIRAKIMEAATNLPKPRTLKQTMGGEAGEDSAATIQLGGPVAESSIAPGEMDAGFPNVTRKIERARLVEQEPVAGGTEAEIIIEEESAAGSEQVAGGPKDLEVEEKMTPGGKNSKKLVGYSDSEEETAPMEDVDAGNGGNAASNDQGVIFS